VEIAPTTWGERGIISHVHLFHGEKKSDNLGTTVESWWGYSEDSHLLSKLGITVHRSASILSGTPIGSNSAYPPFHSPYGYGGISLFFYKHEIRIPLAGRNSGEKHIPQPNGQGMQSLL
jgi:hypothetical protein